jgi:hypothetical protein
MARGVGVGNSNNIRGMPADAGSWDKGLVDRPALKGTEEKETGGSTIARNPDPTVARQVREIDPRLGLEWRPKGQWWTNPMFGDPKKGRPTGASLGSWRLTLDGKSGKTMGLMLLPPWWATSASQGQLEAYLQLHWKPRLQHYGRYVAGLETRQETLLNIQRSKQFAATDHGQLQWAMRKDEAGRRNDGFSYKGHY